MTPIILKDYFKKNIKNFLIILISIVGFISFICLIPQVRKLIFGLSRQYIAISFLFFSFFFFSFLSLLILFLNIPYNKLLHIFLEFKRDPYSFLDENLKKISTDTWLHYIQLALFIIILCIIHFCLISWGDDDYFSHVLETSSLVDFLITRYSNTTSRVLIEAIQVNCYGLNFGIWRILDVIACVAIAECMIIICLENKKYAGIVYFILLFFIDPISLQSAGWGATTANYLWPLATALPVFIITKQIFTKNSLNKIIATFSLALLFFSTNHQQVAVLILGLTIFFLIVRIIQNKKLQKIDLYFIFVMIICIFSILFILTCPATSLRYEKEIKAWFPEYTTISLFDKLQIGVLTILTYYFSYKKGLSIIIPLLMILSFVSYKKNRKVFLLQLSLNLFMILLYLGKKIFKKNFLLSNNKLSQFSFHSQTAVFIECLILLIIALIFLYQVYIAMSNKQQGLLNALLLCAGFCSAFILAFSPTVYVSGSRCYLFMSSIIFIVTFRIFNDFLVNKQNIKQLTA